MNKSKISQPLVSIVIVNWNGVEDTKLCLEYTQKQTYKHTEIIVVDNGSVDNSLEYLKNQDGIKLVVNSKNLGFTGGHIAGYNIATGKYILLLNNDAIMDLNYVQTAVAYLEDDPEVAVLGGRAYFWNDTNPLFDTTNGFYAYQNINPITAEGIFTQRDGGVPREVNNVSGSCVLIRKSVIEKVGYLHDPFFAYYEESDLFARIKRAGHKVVYHPDLAIWHANGKSAERKGSSFSYYMMMRNRFKFAVRNFDNWSLLRFYKFYLKMGIVSSLKSFIPKDNYAMDRAYAKAFWHNTFTFPTSFKERNDLAQMLGKTVNYNQRITREQTTLSIPIICSTKGDVDNCLALSDIVNPWDEIIAITKDEDITIYAQSFIKINTKPLRLCIDRGFFGTHPLNLGIVSATGEWVLFPSDHFNVDLELLKTIDSSLYKARVGKKDLAYFCTNDHIPTGPDQIASLNGISDVIIKHDLVADAGGLQGGIPASDSLRAIIGYAILNKTWVFSKIQNRPAFPLYQGKGKRGFDSLISEMKHAVSEASSSRKKPTVFKRFLIKHYHAQQIYFFIVWSFSTKITIKLKLARLKNLIIFLIRLKRKDLATELKHIRNEVLYSQHKAVDLDKRKNHEKDRVNHFQKHPEKTTLFIITRDRYAQLKKLLVWLERQKIERIVFVDNDSALPPLMDFLKSTKYQVIETGQNVGHTVLWTSSIIKTLLPDDFYIVTDPDVVPVQDSIDVIKRLYTLHEAYPNHLKIGLGLKIDDLPDGYDLKNDVIRWESQFWKHALEPGVYEAGVDTTFALYKPYTYWYFLHPSLRTGEPFTARHLPWYNKSNSLTEEDVFYRLRADQNVNSWDKGKLPERYLKELEKQRR